MKNSFFILGFLISLLISCPPPTPEPGTVDENGNSSGNETAKEFTVYFDANGGDGTIAPMKVKDGTEITLPDGDALSRKYFTFNYWTILGSGSYRPGDKYVITANTNFAANWQRIRVQIVYQSNSETIPDIEDAVDAGSDLILPKNPFASSPAGNYFYGWTTSATATTEADILAPGSSFPVEETALTFYAYWGSESVTEYTVTFFGTTMEPLTFNRYTEEIRLPLYTGEDGMICKGWGTSEAAATVVYYDGGTIPKTDLTGNIILYPILEKDTRVALTYIKNGAEASPEYQTKAFPGTAIQGSTVNLYEVFYVKDDGTDTPYILTGINVTETANGTPVNVTKSDDGKGSPCWSFQAGTEPLTVALLWEVQSIDKYTFNDPMVYCEGNFIEMGVLTDIALSPGMITVTDEAGLPVIPSQKTAICVEINGGIRTHSCYIEFAENIPAGTTYNVIFTVSGQIIHTETVTVSEPQP